MDAETKKKAQEDISEDGALIKIGGKGVSNLRIKLQFTIGESFIVMSGLVRGVEFDEEKNQSKLHFECTHIETPMKNAILSYVYNVIPDEEREIIQAMDLAEKDEKNREDTKSDSSSNEEKKDSSSPSEFDDDSNETSANPTVIESKTADITNVTDPLSLPDIEDDF